MNLEAFFRSRWWLAISVIIPALIACAGSVYLATQLGRQRAEIVRLSVDLAACRAR